MTPSILERAKELFSYDQETGALVYRTIDRFGQVAGWLGDKGYREVSIDGRSYKAHRVIWLLSNGEWPTGQVDHINGARDDNRIINLRDVTHHENQQNQRRPHKNNKGKFIGVSWDKVAQKWRAQIRVNGKKISLGRYESPDLASAVYLKAKRELHKSCTI